MAVILDGAHDISETIDLPEVLGRNLDFFLFSLVALVVFGSLAFFTLLCLFLSSFLLFSLLLVLNVDQHFLGVTHEQLVVSVHSFSVLFVQVRHVLEHEVF